MGNCHPLEVVGRGSETHLQVGKISIRLGYLAGKVSVLASVVDG